MYLDYWMIVLFIIVAGLWTHFRVYTESKASFALGYSEGSADITKFFADNGFLDEQKMMIAYAKMIAEPSIQK